MNVRRGATLDTATTLGWAETADQGPTAGNGFDTRWREDLVALYGLGVTDVRITLDWARLQPKPGRLDAAWVEFFGQILHAIGELGLRPWACLHDGSIPRWFDDDGGFDDDITFTRWWPRWVEQAADHFGGRVASWMPFACIPPSAPLQPWIDTWGILGGGPPVVASVDLRTQSDTIKRYTDRLDLLGAVLTGDWSSDDNIAAGELAAARDRWGGEVREAAEDVDCAMVISRFSTGHRVLWTTFYKLLFLSQF